LIELNTELRNLENVKRPKDTTSQDNIKVEDYLGQMKNLEDLMVRKLNYSKI